MLWKVILIYLAAVSVVSFAVTAWDKECARRGAWRVPERTLLLLSAIGGSVAMYLTMRLIRHKTKHPKFTVGIPVIIILQVVLAAGAYMYFK